MTKAIEIPIKKKIVKNNLNAEFFKKDYEVNTLPSITVPDQSLSVSEIIKQHSSGIMPNVNVRVPIWDGEDDLLPDPKTLDLADRQILAEDYGLQIEETKRKYYARLKELEAEKLAEKLGQQNPNSTAKTPPEADKKSPQGNNPGSEADGKKA